MRSGASGNCHSVQHQVVLNVMREGLKRAEAGDHPAQQQASKGLRSHQNRHAVRRSTLVMVPPTGSKSSRNRK